MKWGKFYWKGLVLATLLVTIIEVLVTGPGSFNGLIWSLGKYRPQLRMGMRASAVKKISQLIGESDKTIRRQLGQPDSEDMTTTLYRIGSKAGTKEYILLLFDEKRTLVGYRLLNDRMSDLRPPE